MSIIFSGQGVARLPNGTLAGSIQMLNRSVKNMTEYTGVPIEETTAMASANPMKLLGLDGHAGEIAAGKAADVAVFDDDFNCHATFVGGALMHNSDNFR